MEVILAIIIILLFYAYLYISNYKVFKKSKYKEVSGNNFKETLHNKGNYGEFEIFHSLEKINAHIKILSNLYIPKEDGTFTEVDIVLLSRTGIYVIESKNYKGNISGMKMTDIGHSLFGQEKNINFTIQYYKIMAT